MSQLPARLRPPEPLPGSPEAIAAAEKREQVLATARAQNAMVTGPHTSITRVQLDDFPELPPSSRLTTIPVAQPHRISDKDGYDLDRVPEATGNKPAANVPHQWSSDWLNDTDGRTCKVCGVVEKSGSLIRADRKGMPHHYVDAFGVAITSMVELTCPTFIGDMGGAVAETKGRVRNLDSQMETVDARLDRLEQHNQYLQDQLTSKIQLDVNGLVNWLTQMVQLNIQNQLPTTVVEVAGLPLEIPSPIADLIRGVGVTIDVKLEDENHTTNLPINKHQK